MKVLVRADLMSPQKHKKMVHFSQNPKSRASCFPREQEACFCVTPEVQLRGCGCCPNSAPNKPVV